MALTKVDPDVIDITKTSIAITDDHVDGGIRKYIDNTIASLNTTTTTAVDQARGNYTNLIANTRFVGDAVWAKANLDSPQFTGYPAVPTAAQNANNTQIANTAYVDNSSWKVSVSLASYTDNKVNGLASVSYVDSKTSGMATTTYVDSKVTSYVVKNTGGYNFDHGVTITGSKSVAAYGRDWTTGLGVVLDGNVLSGAILYALGCCDNWGLWVHNLVGNGAGIQVKPGSNLTALATYTSWYAYWDNVQGMNNWQNMEFAVNALGSIYGGSNFAQVVADYAEYFEWHDGNPMNEDRVGCSVVLAANGKIRVATGNDDLTDIIGVISGTGAFIGNSAELWWKDRYLLDDYGRRIPTTEAMATWTDSSGQTVSKTMREVRDRGIVLPANTKYTEEPGFKVNPLWDLNVHNQYVPRSERKEWATVGLLGQIWVRHDQPKHPNWKTLGNTNESAELFLVK